MIIKGQSSTGKGLGAYLLQPKNDRVEFWGIRGDIARDLRETLDDWSSDALGTQCQKPLYHAQLNPDRVLSRAEWDTAIALFEQEMGFENQPRAIVLHEYKGREHVHLVYSRLNEDGKAISDSWNYLHHEKAARAIENGLGLAETKGAVYKKQGEPRPDRTPNEKSIQQGERTGHDPQAIKAELTALYHEAKGSAAAFTEALTEKGYSLARGDRRGFVVVDEAGGVHSLSRMTGAKAGELAQLLKDYGDLPSVETEKERLALQAEAEQPTPTTEAAAQPPPDRLAEEVVAHEAEARTERERLESERQAVAEWLRQGKDPEPQDGTPHAPPDTRREASNPFADPVARVHAAQITEGGEVEHHGLIMSWAEQAAGVLQELEREAIGFAKGKWQEFVTSRDSPDSEPDR